MAHPFADYRDYGKVAPYRNVVDEAILLLEFEFLLDSRARMVGILRRHGERNRELGRSLRNEDDVYPALSESRKNTPCGGAQARQSAPLYLEHRDVIDRRNTFCERAILYFLRLPPDDGSSRLRFERVLDEKRDISLLRRTYGRRMYDFRAEVGHLDRFVIRHRGDWKRVLYFPRVGRHDAGNVGPNFNDLRAECRPENGRRVVAPAAPPRRRFF